jgi:LysM repeat protein
MIKPISMKKILVFIFLCLFITQLSFAQSADLYVKASDKGLYIEHKVTPKENFYSVGRLYNAPPKEIAAFNGLDMNKGLNLGQVIRIPLSKLNFPQTDNQGIPVYYKTGEKEGLTKVSSTVNKVPVEKLRSWNNLKNDNVNTGARLIVGFLVSPEFVQTDAVKKEAVVEKKQPAVVTDSPITEAKKEIVKEEPKKETPREDNTVKKQPVIEKPKEEPRPTLTEQGYFKTSFEQQVKTLPVTKNQTVTSGIFKTTSGWNDGKYYVLIDNVQPGTIVKVMNPGNNKMIYAKVLGEMSGIRQNDGLEIRVSNAAAAVLQVTETDKFIVKVNY